MNVGIISKNKDAIIDLLIELEDIYYLTKESLHKTIVDFSLLIIDIDSYSKEELQKISNDISMMYEDIPVFHINLVESTRIEEYKSSIKKLITTINNFRESYYKKPPLLVDQLLLSKDVIFDVGRLKLIKRDSQYILTSQEYKILFYLVKNIGHIVSTEKLLEITDIVSKKCLYVHINSLRGKLEFHPSTPSILVTIYKKGYVIKGPLLDKIS